MAVLVDDVATTGATLDEAAVLTGAHLALVANVALGPFGPSHG
jgi:predicted amidophosphoribosyltransferase